MKTMKAMALLLAGIVVLFSAEAVRAQTGTRGGNYQHGGGHHGGGSYHGGNYHGGYYGGRYYRGGYYYAGWGGGYYWGPGPYWWGFGNPYAYYPYPYPYYPPQTVVAQPSEPQVYVERPPPPPQQQYWYYCREPQGYYPYVSQCPSGWTQVAPQPGPPAS